MIKKYVKIIPLAAIFFALSAQADIEITDNSTILGKWKMHDESIKLHGDKKAVDVTWEFKPDGTLQTTLEDKQGRVSDMKIAIKYSIENGGIKKQSSPGREKYELCKIVERAGNEMVVKCTYYFYLTKTN
jgi:hypothetical protein